MTSAALVMSYGSPLGPQFVRQYYTDVRRGRPPTDEQLAELKRRYEAIGGVSPLNERTRAQVDAIDEALNAGGPKWSVFIGTKHSQPTIESAVRIAAQFGIDRIVGLVLAPHYASASVGEYIERAATAANEVGIPATFIERYGDDPSLITILADRVTAALEPFAHDPDGTEVLFTAHSLPLRSIAPTDRYGDEIAETARLVAQQAGLQQWRTGWQSAGLTPDPWLGPDILVTLDELAAEGRRNVVVCACGFTSDHLEILYDLDVVAARHAAELGLGFARTASLNDDPRFAALLARRIVAA